MPSASPICLVNSTATTNGVNVPAASTVTISLASTTGVDYWSLQCISTDETSDHTAVTASLTINALAKTATFTAPTPKRKALIFKSVVNNSLDRNLKFDASLTTTFGVYVADSDTDRVVALNERNEGNANFGWIVALNNVLRSGQYREARAIDISSPTLTVGDSVCITTTEKYTKALAAPLALAGAVLGVVTLGGPPGGFAVAQFDGVLPSAVTGLANSGPTRVNTTTGRLEVVSNFAPDDYPIGYSTSNGVVTMVRGLALNTSGPFVYSSLGGLVGDYNADLETAGALATWTDRSGSLNHVVQATGANQPSVIAGVINGKKVVRFDGTTDFMRKTTFALNANEMSIYIVMSLTAAGTTSVVLGYNVSTVLVHHAGTSGFPAVDRGGGSTNYALNVTGTGFAIRSSQSRNDSSNELFYQGASRGTFTDATAIPTTGSPIDIGAINNGGGFFCQCDIARILIYNKRHTTGQRVQVETQLGLDYAL